MTHFKVQGKFAGEFPEKNSEALNFIEPEEVPIDMHQ